MNDASLFTLLTSRPIQAMANTEANILQIRCMSLNPVCREAINALKSFDKEVYTQMLKSVWFGEQSNESLIKLSKIVFMRFIGYIQCNVWC